MDQSACNQFAQFAPTHAICVAYMSKYAIIGNIGLLNDNTWPMFFYRMMIRDKIVDINMIFYLI